MENRLRVFSSQQFGELEVVLIDEKPWFSATKVASMLGYSNPQKAVRDHCADKGCMIRSVLTNGGEQRMKLINEGNVYRLIVRSKLPAAEKFETWVFDEVLPTVNKYGVYATEELLNNPDFLIQALTQLKNEREKNKRLEAEIKETQPKVAFANAVETSPTSILIRELAKIIKQNGYDIGGTRLFSWMRNNGYLVKKRGTDYNMPTQRAMDMGLFEIKEALITVGRNIEIKRTTKVTGKGQVYFVNKFIKSDN